MGWPGFDRLYRRSTTSARYSTATACGLQRYYITHDDRVIMASEVGVLPTIEPSNVKIKGRLQPGKMFLVDFDEGRLIPDEELKSEFARRRPYGKWVQDQRISLNDLEPETAKPHGFDSSTLLPRMQAFGYTVETMQFMLLPLIAVEKDPIGSMGNDSCLACLSDKPRMLYDYFRQLFAQVTNPAIDSIREEVIMSLECYIGPGAATCSNFDRVACPSAAGAASDSVQRTAWRR